MFRFALAWLLAANFAANAPALMLPKGERAVVHDNGIAQIFSKDRRFVETKLIDRGPYYDLPGSRPELPQGARLAAALSSPLKPAYLPNRVVVVYRQGVTASARLHWTTDSTLNAALAELGVNGSQPLFGQSLRRPQSGLDFTNAYRLHVSRSSVRRAVEVLRKLPEVVYASPDWMVSTMRAPAIPLLRRTVEDARGQGRRMREKPRAFHLGYASPSNYALTSSAQSMLNAPGVDASAAFDEIGTRFSQLPGAGEIVTNVSIGDLDDASAKTNVNDPCGGYVAAYGPTTVVQGGQRYLDLPSMPLIPTYTAGTNGAVDPSGEVCGADPAIGEIGLDFSVMTPLPHDVQRPGEQGSAYTDLLGIAPGASYRLVVPAASVPGISDIDAALLAASQQTPKPNVITASLGFGFDVYGFPSRYLEEDPLTESIVAAIVAQNIVVCIAGGDGTRTFTKAAIGPSGGSSPTQVAATGYTTKLDDDYLSTIPSVVVDSGAIDVGASTLDDIFADPPQYARGAGVAAHAYAETRWTGFTSFSTGFGSRVDICAPGDNVLSFEHRLGGAADAVDAILEGGTSASAPEVAAAAAVVLQVARLMNRPFADAGSVRSFLARTGSPVAAVPQADNALAIGRQIDLRAAVEALLAKSYGPPEVPHAVRVAVDQRRNYADLDGAFVTDTDDSAIDLAGPSGSGNDQLAWITIAPDWEFVPAGVTYRLFVNGRPHAVLATTPWARLLPARIFRAAGLPAQSSASRPVRLTYQMLRFWRVVATAKVTLTFGPNAATTQSALAPQIPALVAGNEIPVTYDLTGTIVNAPQLVVSEPGRIDPATGQLFHAVYSLPLTKIKGTVNVSVSALQGGGIYGVGIELDSTTATYSDFAFTRVAAAGSFGTTQLGSGVARNALPPRLGASGIVGRPPAPLLFDETVPAAHVLEVPYNGTFQVRYDVGGVGGATGGIVEISAPGPTAWNIDNPFNDPNGTTQDRNGVDAGSVYRVDVGGTEGTVTLSAQKAGLFASLNHVVRVIPTRFGLPIGEASDVSTVTMDGVQAADGGSVVNGWGIDQNGEDGFITSASQASDGQVASSLESFDQTDNRILKTIASATGELYFTPQWGVYGGDVGIFGTERLATKALSFNVLDTVATGTVGAPWYPPHPVLEAAANGNTATGAYVYTDGGATGTAYVFTSNVARDAFGAAFNVMAPVSTFSAPVFFGIAQDTQTNTAVLPAYDVDRTCVAPVMVRVDLTGGNVTSFPSLGLGTPFGIAVDSTTGKAAVPTGCDDSLSIYDLASGTGSKVVLPQPQGGAANGLYTAADGRHGMFLVEETSGPDVFTNDNSLSRILVYDESGDLIETIPRFSLFESFLPIQANDLQVNPSLRSGYLIGPSQQQLIPFTY